MSNAATDGASITYLLIADLRCSLWQQSEISLKHIRTLNRRILRHRTHGDRSIFLTDIGEPTDPAKVNYVSGLRQAQFHRRQQAMPPCQ